MRKKSKGISEYEDIAEYMVNVKTRKTFDNWNEIKKLREENFTLKKEVISFKEILNKFLKKRYGNTRSR